MDENAQSSSSRRRSRDEATAYAGGASTAEQERAPSLTRGFLFADIRDYTGFADREGDAAAAELLRAYRDLVRTAIHRHRGAEIRTEGDSFYVVFPSVSDAVRCALEVLRDAREASEERPDRPISVGVGVHAGETVETEDGYVGTAVNIAARICAQAPSGEVLVSETVRFLTRTTLANLAFLPRGRQRLKGIAEPIVLYRVLPREEARAVTPAGGRLARPPRLLHAVAGIAGVAAAVVLMASIGIALWTAAPGLTSAPGSSATAGGQVTPGASLPALGPGTSAEGAGAVDLIASVDPETGGVFLYRSDRVGITRIDGLRAVSTASLSPDGQWIAVDSMVGSDGQSVIEIARLDGSERQEISPQPGAADTTPAWSPDGTRIAFARAPAPGQPSAIVVVDLAGSAGAEESIVQLTDPMDESHGQPTWSPDGRSIAFVGPAFGTLLGVVALDCSSLRWLPQLLEAETGGPAWSPDGSLIAFTGVPHDGGAADIYVAAPDGPRPRQLTTDPGADEDPTWSPDGSRLAFVSTRSGQHELYSMKADGSGVRQLTENLGVGYGGLSWARLGAAEEPSATASHAGPQPSTGTSSDPTGGLIPPAVSTPARDGCPAAG